MTARPALSARVFKRVTFRDVAPPHIVDDGQRLDQGVASTQLFFDRLPPVELRDKAVLDYGCGDGVTCIELAQRGARQVLGVDIGSVDWGQRMIRERYPELADRVELRQVAPDGTGLPDERFDVVISKDTFEHVGDPHAYVAGMRAHLAPGGRLVIGFGPLWKSPFGGHLNHMTKLPWAHLVFPERVVLAERQRFRPDEQPAPERYEDVKGGLNRMTLARFEQVMHDSGLVREHFEVNRSNGRAVALMKLPSRVPALREYFTSNVYSVWREP